MKTNSKKGIKKVCYGFGTQTQRSESRPSTKVWITPKRSHPNNFYGGFSPKSSLLVIYNHTSDEYTVTIDGNSAGTIIGKCQKSFGQIAKGSHNICFIQIGTSNPCTFNRVANVSGDGQTIGIDIP